MDLLGKVAVIVVLLIVVFSAAIILTRHTGQTQLTAAQAEQFVLNDLRSSNPGANVTVLNISNSTLKAGSYNIVLSIAYNSTKPCPTLFIEEFDYPATGLVPSLDNLYTKNCTIYGLSSAPSFVISSPEIAIARSYNQNVSTIIQYVNTFGYDNTAVSATFYPYLNNTLTHQSQSYYNAWLINYDAKNANYSVYTIMYSNGSVVETYLNLTK